MSYKLLALTGAGSYVATPGTLVALPDLGVEVTSLRPRSFVRVLDSIEVKPDGSKDYTTIGAALTAAASLQSAQITADNNGGIKTPNHHVEIIIHPGTYTITTALQPAAYVSLISATGVPGHVVIRSTDVATALGAIVTNGSFYFEGLDIVRAGSAGLGGKYCHHIALHDFETGVYAQCRFYMETQSTTGGWTTVGMDGAPGIGLLFHECAFYSNQSGSYLPGGTNLHGLIAGAPSGSAISNIIFKRTTGGAVGYDALTNLVADDIWVDGGTYTSVTGTGTLVEVHHGNGATGTMTAPAGAVTNLTGMPTFSAGMTQREREHYFGTAG